MKNDQGSLLPVDPTEFRIRVMRGKKAAWVAEVVADVPPEIIIAVGQGDTPWAATAQAWQSWQDGENK